jgi:hypothetical protein
VARLERKVKIAEREYLELLHSLNMSKLRQQNLELSADLEVMDWPFFPNKAEATKRMQLVVLAGILGFIMCVTIIILLEFIDRTLQNPQRTRDETGLALAAAVPVAGPHHQSGPRELVLTRSVDQIINAIKLAIPPETDAAKSNLILVTSNLPGEGKSFLQQHVVAKLRYAGMRVLSLSPDTASGNTADDFAYAVNADFPETRNIASLLKSEPKADFVFLELPPLIGHQFPLHLLKQAQVMLLVLNANRAWKDVDVHTLAQIRQAGGPEPLAVLNATRLHYLDSMLGDGALKKSWIIRLVVNLLNLEFTNLEKLARRTK